MRCAKMSPETARRIARKRTNPPSNTVDKMKSAPLFASYSRRATKIHSHSLNWQTTPSSSFSAFSVSKKTSSGKFGEQRQLTTLTAIPEPRLSFTAMINRLHHRVKVKVFVVLKGSEKQ
jgi:hypothetical protein